MKLHKRLAETVQTKEVRSLLREIEDRYGRAPAAAKRLFKMGEIRIEAARKNLGRIEVKADKIYLYKSGKREPILFDDHIPHLRGVLPDKRLNAILRLVRGL
jgi:transcription-repair coupling factor (superfamily II helicase)